MNSKEIDNQSVFINDRNSIDISGVKSVISFDDESILINTVLGRITIKGENLSISNFNDEIGDFKAIGKIHGVVYLADNKSDGGFFSRILK